MIIASLHIIMSMRYILDCNPHVNSKKLMFCLWIAVSVFPTTKCHHTPLSPSPSYLVLFTYKAHPNFAQPRYGMRYVILKAKYSVHVCRIIVWDIETMRAVASYRGEVIDIPTFFPSFLFYVHPNFVVTGHSDAVLSVSTC